MAPPAVPNAQTLPWDSRPIKFPSELPITQRKDEIVSAIKSHQVLVLSGETGSGKTTQLPKMCLEAGLGRSKHIACTQPRRVAALSVAKRVAEELEVDFGAEVGAKIRFTDQTSQRTRVKFMTDGMLLSEIQSDPLMGEYDAVIVDEAHERSLNIDFLLGHLNQIRAKRADLKIIITSATIDTEKFSQTFGGAPIIEVSGRLYPVEVIYAPLDELLEESGDFTYVEGIAESAQRIQDELGQGDILAFLPTEKDIREAMDLLERRFGNRMEIVPCYGRLSSADQQRIFLPTAKRKLVLATNIAETSLTIPGIRFVIDTGLARISRYNARARTQRLPIVKISQSSANQRKGRCGRVADGICIRLYSESDFESRPIYSTPEIQRANLADVILRMIASRLGEVETFPFIDPPAPAAVSAGYTLLQELGALRLSSSPSPSSSSSPPTSTYHLTTIGRKLAKLPIDPTVGRMLLEAERRDVVEPLLVIASALSIQDPRERPMDKEAAAKQAHARFTHPESDFLTLLNIWEALHDEFQKLSQSKLRKFCKHHFLNYLRMREWRDVYDQLKRAIRAFDKVAADEAGARRSRRARAATDSPSQDRPDPKLPPDSALYHAVHSCLLTGLLANPGRREETNLYRCPGNRKALVFPGSGLFIRQAAQTRAKAKPEGQRKKAGKKGPEWIVAGEIVETNRLYARAVAAIDPRWLLEVGEHVVTRSYSEPQFLPAEGRVAARESIRIHGLEIQDRKVSYLKVDPAKATEIFIREALLNEEFEAPRNWSFLEKNRQLMRRVQNAQTVVSVAHWMGVEEAAFRFYRKRLENVASVHDLNRYLKSRPSSPSSPSPAPLSDPLLMQEADLTAAEDAAVDLSLFPESIQLENSALPLAYEYRPGSETDGVTLRLPYSKASSIDSAMLDWLVPGHLEPKILHLLKALPKRVRQRLIPLAETAKQIAREIRPTGQTLAQSLAQHLEKKYSLETYASDWDESAIPSHLRARLEVHDKTGNTLAQGRDLAAVQAQLKEREATASHAIRESARDLWQRARDRYERPIPSVAALEETLSSLPSVSPHGRIQIGQQNGVPVYAYLALRDPSRPLPASKSGGELPTSNPPTLTLFPNAEEATAASRAGIAALIEHECRRDLAWTQRDLKDVERLGPVAVAFRPIAEIKRDVFEHIRQAIRAHGADCLDPSAVERAKTAAKGLLYRVVDQLKEILEKRQSLLVRGEISARYVADLERIAPPDFLRHVPHWALSRIPVYLDTIERRANKASRDPLRHAEREGELQRYRSRWDELAKRHPEAAQDPNSELARLRFSIEELAVSLFAQERGTAFSISPKKLDKAFHDLALHVDKGGPPEPQPSRSQAEPASPSDTGAAKSGNAAPDRPTKADLEGLKKLFG